MRSARVFAALVLPLLLAAALAPGCESSTGAPLDASADAEPADSASPDLWPAVDAGPAAGFYLQVDDALPGWLAPRLRQLLGPASPLPLRQLGPGESVTGLPAGSVVLSVGQTAALVQLVPQGDAALAGLKPDGFLLRSGQLGGVTVIATTGRGEPALHQIGVNRGALYGAYAALERLGFAFLHPLAPHRPAAIRLPQQPLSEVHAPRWPERGIHLHTMHPLELTDLLNGWGEAGMDDEAGFERMLSEWRLFCEWMLANRQNMVEWMPLWAKEWAEFADSSRRQGRLARLVQIAHRYGLAAGVDVGIALEQQHNFRLVREQGDLAQELAQIRTHADYLMGAGFDFLSTENGTSEFTSPDDKRMLAWMDELSSYLARAHGAEAHIKIHCSTGQDAPSFSDPRTGGPLNFNFLPHYAAASLGVLPHTVQLYALDDPAPTYGNTDFGYMRDFIRMEAGRRRVLWHPETAYWVSYDVDVPLFLPLYAERRLHDLRLLARDEEQGQLGRGALQGSRMQGQMIFSSGWEWGYWLNDVVAARAAYDPRLAAASTAEALRGALTEALALFGPARDAVVAQLLTMVREQRELLVLGQVDGKLPKSVEKRNGQAYLQGWEAFDDLISMASGLPFVPSMETQPDKLGLVELRNPLHAGPDYTAEVRPLLARMAATFAAHHGALAALREQVPRDARGLYDELLDAALITALRAQQVQGLYEYVDGLNLLGQPSAAAKQALARAEQALADAQLVVGRREQHYRVPADRIAGWRENPTAYRFGYLWSVRRLHYWWRDQGKAVDAPQSPCYRNIMDPAKIAFGEGVWVDAVPLIQKVLNAVGLGGAIGDCLTAPATEPTYP